MRQCAIPLWADIRGEASRHRRHFATRPHRSLHTRPTSRLTSPPCPPLAPTPQSTLHISIAPATHDASFGRLPTPSSRAHTRRLRAPPVAMPARKRAAAEMEADDPVPEPTTLQRLRNMWQFANLAQYISLFGDAVKIDKDFDIEVCPTCAGPFCTAPADCTAEQRLTCAIGVGGRVPQAPAIRKARPDWPGSIEARLITQGPHVRNRHQWPFQRANTLPDPLYSMNTRAASTSQRPPPVTPLASTRSPTSSTTSTSSPRFACSNSSPHGP